MPSWLAQRMEKLGAAIAESIIYNYGVAEFLSRLSDPFWFQSFGAVMGMDWHSSGITTSVMGALKRGLNSRADELGLYICGGRGKQSRKTPSELQLHADANSLDGKALVRASRLTAKIDNNAIADGFQIYLHNFVLARTGEWAVVQQGMNTKTKLARRYHWHSANTRDFVCEPHTGIIGENEGEILNLVDRRARPAQDALLAISRETPESTLRDIEQLKRGHLVMPDHHDVRAKDVDLKRLGAVLTVSYERQLRDFASLLLLENLGPRTLQTLTLVAEVIHGAPSRFSDPARFSFSLGGKDGHPFPVPLKTYDESLAVLRRSLDSAKLGHTDKVAGFKRLDNLVRNVENRLQPLADFERILEHERTISKSLGGRIVLNDKPPKGVAAAKQLSLFGAPQPF